MLLRAEHRKPPQRKRQVAGTIANSSLGVRGLHTLPVVDPPNGPVSLHIYERFKTMREEIASQQQHTTVLAAAAPSTTMSSSSSSVCFASPLIGWASSLIPC